MFDIYIYNAMKKQAITQNELAKKVGISNACMSKMKTAKILGISENHVYKLARTGFKIHKLLYPEDFVTVDK